MLRPQRPDLDSLLEGIQIIGQDWRYLYLNQTMLLQVNAKREDLLGFTMMEKFPGVEATPMFATLRQTMQDRVPRRLLNEFTFPDGSTAWFELAVEPYENGLRILSLDVTSHKRAELRLQKSRLLYAFLSQINQAIVHLEDSCSLIEEVCRIARDSSMFEAAAIIIRDGDGSKTAVSSHVGHESLLAAAARDIDLDLIKDRKLLICEPGADDGLLMSWKDFERVAEIRSCVILPLLMSGETFGAYCLFSKRDDFSDTHENDMLMEVAADISFALSIYRARQRHQQAEAMIEANERRFRALTEKSAEMKTMASAEGNIIYGSPAITLFLGYELPDMMGTSLFDLFHPEDAPAFIDKRNKTVREEGGSFNFEMRIKHREGHWVWCEGVVTNLLHVPEVQAMVANFIDITARKAAEQRREFDHNNMMALINNTADIMWSVGRDSKLISANHSFDQFTLWKFGREFVPGDELLLLSSLEQRIWYSKAYAKALAGVSFTATHWIDRPKKTCFEISFAPIKSGGQVVGVACQMRDVTAQKLQEENLISTVRELSDYKYALDASSIVAITDQKGVIQHVNENFIKISGYGTEELIGRNHKIINSGYHTKEFIRNLWRTIASGAIWKGELRNRAKNGDLYWVDTTIVPFLDNDGKPYQYIAIRSDISARKAAEEALIEQNDELQKANLELDRFVYSVSHDLRAPVTSIKGLVSLMQDETSEPQTLEYAAMIQSSLGRLDSFIRNILNYSRNNRMDLKVEHIPVARTIDEIAKILVPPAMGIAVHIDVKEAERFYSDQFGFATIVENLLSNASKFKNGGHPQIRISGYVDQKVLQLEISDNGMGIDPKYLDRIFDMFFRISGQIEGTGIGLYIVREIVRKLDGAISVASQPQKGTSFQVTLKNYI